MKRRKFLFASTLLPFTALQSSRVKGNETKSNVKKTVPSKKHYGDKKEFFYKPADAWAADFIPLFAEGEFQLFYLPDWRDARQTRRRNTVVPNQHQRFCPFYGTWRNVSQRYQR